MDNKEWNPNKEYECEHCKSVWCYGYPKIEVIKRWYRKNNGLKTIEARQKIDVYYWKNCCRRKENKR